MNNVYLDIETIPSQSEEYRAQARENITAPAQYKKPESIAAWKAENGEAAANEVIAKTSFDPAAGHICTIGFAIGDGGSPTCPIAIGVAERRRAAARPAIDELVLTFM